ncbi:MAG TPA: thioredoxin family protein [Sulfurospirillum arcachonense]|nr:thioredoxin family protein [Sulfurospirillum arcachonense]HIP43727.1 thioredoxin family protein [Sulfurospirillum arcachonense]
MSLYKKIFILVLFSITISQASTVELFNSLGYSKDYTQALKYAKKENKPMMLVISTKTCPWCRKLEQQVLKRKNINKQVQNDFIGVPIEKDRDIYPTKFKPKIVPTIVFVNPKDESVIHTSYGYKPKKEFSILLKEVLEEYKKVTK